MTFIDNLPNTYTKSAYILFFFAKIISLIAIGCVFADPKTLGSIFVFIYGLFVVLSVGFGIAGGIKDIKEQERVY